MADKNDGGDKTERPTAKRLEDARKKGDVATLRAVKELAGQAGDNATDGIVDDWTDQAQERAWFLTETLGK